jgi:hypothetical protein
MDDKLSRAFGHVIAFLIPGFVALWGLSYIVGDIRAWLGTAGSASTTVGSFFIVVIASLGLGVFVSGARYFVFDEGLLNYDWFSVPAPAPDDVEARRLEERTQSAYEDLRDQFYRYYQFYANAAVALALSFIAWAATGAAATIPWWAVTGGFLLGELVLVASARDSITKFRNKKRALLSALPPARGGEGSPHDERRRGQADEGLSKAESASTETGLAKAGTPETGPAASTSPSQEDALTGSRSEDQ